MGKSQIIGLFGISHIFLGVFYFKKDRNDFRPLSSSVYIAEGADRRDMGVRRIASGLSEHSLLRAHPARELARLDFY